MKARTVLIITASFLVIAAAVVVVLFFQVPESRYRELGRMFDRIDEKIASGFFRQAEEDLLVIETEKLSVESWLMLIKRGIQIAEGTDDYRHVKVLTDQALEAYPGNTVLRSISAYVLMREGDFRSAWALAEKLNPEEDEFIRAEAFLRYRETDPDSNTEEKSLFIQADQPSEYLSLADITGNVDYALDAALLEMGNGDIEMVSSILRDYPALKEKHPEAVSYLLADCGSYGEAVDLMMPFSDHPMEFLFIADLYMLEYRWDLAENIYRSVIAENPEYAWQAYNNLAWIMRDRSTEEVRDILQQGLEQTGEGRLLTAQVDLLSEIDPVWAEQILGDYLEVHPEDPDAHLLQIKEFPVSVPWQDFNARLWGLYNNHPKHQGIASYLIWFLIGIRDLESVDIVCQRCTLDFGEQEWIAACRGIAHAAEGDFTAALEDFQEAFTLGRSWTALYNQALIHLYFRNYGTALDLMLQSEGLLSPDEEALTASRFHTDFARVYLLTGDKASAERELTRALDLDGDNLKAVMLGSAINGENP